MKSVTPQEHKMLNEQFWDKNKRLARPTSPHLTIYKPQMTSLLSVTHRGTGLAQSVILTGFAVGAIASNSTFPIFLAYLQSWKFGGALIFLGKFALAWPVTYHLFNGLRHLVSLSIIPFRDALELYFTSRITKNLQQNNFCRHVQLFELES